MRYTKLTVLGLCAVIVGLMAFGASAAQAEPNNAWVILVPKDPEKPHENVEEVLVTDALAPLLQGQIETVGILQAHVLEGSVHVEITCTGGTLTGVHLQAEGKLTKGGKVTFTGCSVKLNGEAAPECKVHSAGEAVGTVSTNKGEGLLRLHEGVLVTLVKPEGASTVFVTLLMGSECVLGEEVPVEGELVIEDCEGAATTHLVTHLIEEEAALTNLTVLDDPNASIEGSALVSLAGTHEGLLWGAEMIK